MREESRTVECPCCGYICLKSGEYGEICQICYWEYDEEVEFRGTNPSVLNHGLTLIEARNNFDQFGACEERLVQYCLPPEARKEYKHVSET
ncbi:CPCC family cysteine-rich protein [Marinobacter zhejiangensis]